ncbi:hypothetical protein G6F68_020277 [Rhizopus microsporus]|nr:hypothetical protein G6F68_020277 [Rhizopus microsporus]
MFQYADVGHHAADQQHGGPADAIDRPFLALRRQQRQRHRHGDRDQADVEVVDQRGHAQAQQADQGEQPLAGQEHRIQGRRIIGQGATAGRDQCAMAFDRKLA